MEEVFDFTASKHVILPDSVRQKSFICKTPLSIKAMVRLAGVGHEVPAPASLIKIGVV